MFSRHQGNAKLTLSFAVCHCVPLTMESIRRKIYEAENIADAIVLMVEKSEQVYGSLDFGNIIVRVSDPVDNFDGFKTVLANF